MSKDIEKIWTDDSIRWLNAEKESVEDEQDESDAFFNIFHDSATTFRFEFNHPQIQEEQIVINLQGYKYDSHETYKSTGLTIWRAAETLCNYLIQQHEMLHQKNILELGAGLGLCGILVQQIALDSKICITDGDTGALAKLRENISQNKVVGNVSCRQLLWGRENSNDFLKFNHDGELYDVIIASDILYSSVVVEPLWQTIEILLKMDGIFIMAFAERNVPLKIETFLQAGVQSGFLYECVSEENIVATGGNTPGEQQVWIYLFHRK